MWPSLETIPKTITIAGNCFHHPGHIPVIVSLSDMIEGSYRSWDLYTTDQLVDGLHQKKKKKKRKPVFIKRKWNCCGADKRVDSANKFKGFYAHECMLRQPETMEEDRRRDNRYNKSDDFIAGITNVYVNVRGSCMWSSARMGYVDSWCGRVVVVRSWTFDESSWRRSSRGDTARCLMRVS